MRNMQPTSYWAKTKCFPSKIRNKTRLSIFTTSIHHSIGSYSHSDQTRKSNKSHPNWKGGSKTVGVFADDMIVYIGNPIHSTKKLLDLISDFVKIAGYKVFTQKSKAFLTTNNEISETEVTG